MSPVMGRLDFPSRRGHYRVAIGLGIKAANHEHRVAFGTAVDWVARLAAAHPVGTLPADLVRLRRVNLPITERVGYILFEQDATTCSFSWCSAARNTPR